MASQIQLVIYEGYLGDDPEMHFTKTGRAVTNFRMGSSRMYKTQDGENKKETTWLKVSCWGNLAEIANQWCEKGSQVVVFGILRANENGSPSVYQLKSGDWAASFEITADKLRILKGKNGGVNIEAEAEDNSDIPF